ncbi:hypothetical protein WG219_05850 [Ectopseudomonas mendocina]|uniref:DUF4365 domain-containing protein n=1 Tax=Ectopseudomonas mendocina TaxID=300 RepID=A0ABZ2RIY6_ECTME
MKLTLKTGTEPFTAGGQPVGRDLQSFWRWAFSDVLNNALRGVLAEYIVASALDCNHGVRTQWDAYDLKTASGIRIEVKSAAYLQSWGQKGLSAIQFSIAPAAVWDALTQKRSPTKVRAAQVYVFCVLTSQDKEAVNPLNLDQWDFYCLSASSLNEQVGAQRQISLKRLESLGARRVGYLALAATVQSLANQNQC